MNQLPIFDRAIAHAQRIALVENDVSHTYKDLVAASAAVARSLLGDSDDLNQERVAFLVPAGFDYTRCLWGIWRSGGVALPLSHSATENELEYALTDSASNIVVTTRELAPKITGLCGRLSRSVLVIDDLALDDGKRLPQVAPTRRAMILYTSGTTSKPKGVVTTHACIQSQIESLVEAWHWQQDDSIPLFLPLHHIHGIINVMSCALWTGARIEVFRRFDRDMILNRVASDVYTIFMAVPTIYVKLIEVLEAMSGDARLPFVQGFAKMRLMVSGSAALPARVHEKWTELTTQKLLERYGMTEIGMAISNPYLGERRPGAVGQALPGVEIRLVSENGEIVSSENVSGEIQVRGANVFSEYWNRPQATVESFQDGWFRTGDIAVCERGYYRIMGRSSVDIIKSGGYKLSALEIEAALLDHPSISECAVVGVPDETWGESVAAAIVLRPNSFLDVDTLRAWCDGRISPYKIPRLLHCVDTLPRNAMGKVTKPDVLKLFQTLTSPGLRFNI